MIFRTHPVPIPSVLNRGIPLKDNNNAQRRMSYLTTENIAKGVRHCSTNAYLDWMTDQLHLGMTTYTYESSIPEPGREPPEFVTRLLGLERSSETVNGIALF